MESGEPEPIANPKLARLNKKRASRVALASVLIAAAATVGVMAIPLR